MKTIIQRPEKSRCQVRHTMIKECLELGYKPIRVTEQKAQELCFGGRNYIHVPKSLYKNKVKKHYGAVINLAPLSIDSCHPSSILYSLNFYLR